MSVENTYGPGKPPLRLRARRLWRRLGRLFGSQALFAVLLLLLAMTVLAGFLHYYFEKDVNPDVTSLASGFQWMLVVLIATASPWPILTTGGKLVQYGVLLIKPGLVAVITAAIAAKLLQLLMRRNKGMGEANDRDHILICGWSGKGEEIIKEIRGTPGGEYQPVVVLAPLEEKPTKDEMTTFISGDPTNADDLKRAAVETAQSAIILADNSYPGIDIEEMDSRTLLATLAVEAVRPDCYTCVEVIHSENRVHFDRTTANELVVTGRLTGALLAHSAVTHGLSRVVGDLVTKPEGDEFYWLPVPERLNGRTFASILGELKETHDVVPIAVSTGDDEYDINPPATRELRTNDRLLVIAKKAPASL